MAAIAGSYAFSLLAGILSLNADSKKAGVSMPAAGDSFLAGRIGGNSIAMAYLSG